MGYMRFPKLTPGASFGSMSAAAWNRVMVEIEAVANLSVTPPLTMRRVGRALSIGIRREPPTKRGQAAAGLPQHFLIDNRVSIGGVGVDMLKCVPCDGDGENPGPISAPV